MALRQPAPTTRQASQGHATTRRVSAERLLASGDAARAAIEPAAARRALQRLSGGRIAAAQRAVADAGALAPAELLSLQRTYGNRTVARLLDGACAPAQGEPLQRWVQRGKSGEFTAMQLLNKFKLDCPDEYALAQEQVGPSKAPRMDDAAIREFLRGPVEDDKQHYLANVFKDLAEEIRGRQTRESFVPSGALDGAEIALESVGVDLPRPVIVKEDGGQIDLHPSSDINFTAKGSYKRPDGPGGPWRVGIVQTLLHASRTVKLVNETGVHNIMINVPAAHNDRRDAPPWYDRMWTSALDKPFGFFNISLDDKPGMRFPSIPGTSLLGSAGADLFKTWLMLRNEGNDSRKFLYEWSWQVSYDPGGDAALTGETDSTTGAGAVLDGPRATQDYQDTRSSAPTWNIPSQASYRTMKKNAKKLLTPGSAMMPVATYGQLRTTAVDQLRQGNLAGALQTLKQIKAGLDAMAQKKGYWKSDLAKTQYFTPILDAVDDVMAKLGAL